MAPSTWRRFLNGNEAAQCQHGAMAAEQLSYAMDVLAARGEIDPASPEADAFVQASLFGVSLPTRWATRLASSTT